jgi:hypothetical protein
VRAQRNEDSDNSGDERRSHGLTIATALPLHDGREGTTLCP